MKTLLTLFDKERIQLQKEIDKATSLPQVVKLVQNRLDQLERVYISDLNVSQLRLASLFLDTLRQSVAALSAASEIQIPAAQSREFDATIAKPRPNRLILKILQGLICTGSLGSLFSLSQHDPGVWMPILLLTILVGLEVVLQLDKNAVPTETNQMEVSEVLQPVVRVDTKVLLDNLADALNTIDSAIARASEGKKALEGSGLEELPDLLNLIQRLWGASVLEKPQMALELTKLLPQVLNEQGIRAQLYHPDNPPKYAECFDFEPSIDPDRKEYLTITPALFQGDRLIRRGRVIVPVQIQSTQSN